MSFRIQIENDEELPKAAMPSWKTLAVLYVCVCSLIIYLTDLL